VMFYRNDVVGGVSLIMVSYSLCLAWTQLVGWPAARLILFDRALTVGECLRVTIQVV